jgi:di/tricarboxylate transporter
MGADAWVTVVTLLLLFGLLATERLPVSAGMAVAVGILWLTGVIDERGALAGFSSSAPFTIAALYVVAGAAAATGAISPLIDRVLGSGGDDRHDRRRLGRLLGIALTLSAVLPNTPLVAIVAPRVVTWAKRTGRSASRYLMPLSFAAVLGGVVTVIGTSTNLVISDLLRATGDESLGVFEITPVGLPVALVGGLLLVLLAPVLLDHRSSSDDESVMSARRYTMAMMVVDHGALVGKTVSEAGLRHLRGVFLVGIERHQRVLAVSPDDVLQGADILYFVGDVTDVVDLTEVDGLRSSEATQLAEANRGADTRLFEAVVSERSGLSGTTLRESGFRTRFGGAVLAIRRHDDELPGKLGDVVLRPGDVLLVLGPGDFARQWGAGSEFAVVASLDEQPPVRRERAWLVLVGVAAMVGLAVTGVLTLLEASLATASALVVLKVVSPTEARRAVNLNVVFTIALSISLGGAVQASGLAAEVARALARVGDPFGDTGRILAVLVATMILTELLSNNAAAAIMFPIAVATAAAAGLDPRSMALVVLIGASCSFLSPIGYQTNLMVYSLGGYRFSDFSRLGAPLTLATLVVTPIVVPLVLPLR